MRRLALLLLLPLPFLAPACGDAAAGPQAAADAGPEPTASVPTPIATAAGLDATAPLPPKNIKHVVLIVQENHTFDAYFGAYCTAKAGSNPSCTEGPDCCEGAPAKEPTGGSPVVLDDAANAAYDPTHTQVCEAGEINSGAMDHFVKGTQCSDARNFAVVAPGGLPVYHGWAGEYALGDRYFQPIVGSSSSNDMYFAVARFVFTDNEIKPDSNGSGCTLPAKRGKYSGVTTLPDLLIERNFHFSAYIQGYRAMLAATICPPAPPDCPAKVPTTPCTYDPSDTPFQYYDQFTDNSMYMKDYDDLAKDITAGKLPELAFVKAVQYKNEHPGYGTRFTMGQTFVKDTVGLVLSSKYADDTLVVLTWDEGGGYFDHVSPPPASAVDGKPYGTRVPILALGKFARKNHVSHEVMEHSSVVRFVEWNFTDKVGQLGGRDAVVKSIASLLDPATTRLPPD